MRNFKFTLAYDGTDYHGWQVQSEKPTIQGALTEILRRITQEDTVVHGAGRTDAGVHAFGQVANFRTRSALSAAEFQRACNALLPPAIRIVAAEEVGPDFHARWGALGKTYRYRLYRERVVPPSLWRYVLHYPFPLDEAAMAAAAQRFVGRHDFASFAASTGSEQVDPFALTHKDDHQRSTVREIFSVELGRDAGGEELHFTVRGKSFLRYMVRKMTGALLDVGRGKLRVEDIERLYDLRDRSKSGPTVPPHGLWLLAVEYAEPWRIAAT